MTPMTSVNPTVLLREVLGDGHKDLMLSMLAKMLADVMEAEVTARCGAGPGERTPEREHQRNGYRQRPLETRMGTVDLAIPKLRTGSYLPSFIEPRRRWEQAFVNVVATAYVEGVSTRKVEQLVEAMGAKGMSKSEVSRMAVSLDAQVAEFRERRLDHTEFPYVWLDALYVKVRDGGRIVSKAVLVAFGVNENGEREVLGVQVSTGEMEPSWRAFLQGLIGRGLKGVRLVMSDAHTGLRAAIRNVLNATTCQRCYVHFTRDVLSHLPKSSQGFVAAALRNEVAELVMEAEDDVLAYFAFPEGHRKQIRSTNPLERLNKELRRRVRVVGIFPNDAAVLRLVGMMLVEQNDEWSASDRRYFSAASMKQLYGATEPTPDERPAPAAK